MRLNILDKLGFYTRSTGAVLAAVFRARRKQSYVVIQAGRLVILWERKEKTDG